MVRKSGFAEGIMVSLNSFEVKVTSVAGMVRRALIARGALAQAKNCPQIGTG
jgi:hypothetical protein